eukprot:CAMPEP_0171765800 /NCGR_PEP_ID=MMETSP0991-20121206/50861_1 /TAXON_ID=483369 /ORGANISM="non described non described, Strain CCMP2098" /LENGTH=164 /DNA_ID=CAMNT_0012370311 /DNA_START=208 /DNA_END=704 /DNA_ORIENTATION=-
MARKNVTSSSLYWVRPSSSLPSPLLAEQLDDDEDEVANDKDDEGVPGAEGLRAFACALSGAREDSPPFHPRSFPPAAAAEACATCGLQAALHAAQHRKRLTPRQQTAFVAATTPVILVATNTAAFAVVHFGPFRGTFFSNSASTASTSTAFSSSSTTALALMTR